MFQQTTGDLFNDQMHTQAGLPHLMQFLWNQYTQWMQTEIDKLKTAGKPAITIEQAIKRASATSFVEFAAGYLNEHRPVETFFVDANHGIKLSNNVCVVVSPGVAIRGTMQDSHAVPITEGRSQEGQNGVIDINQGIQI